MDFKYMNLIPAIDLIDGELVRLHKGNYEKKTVYSVDPIDMIRSWENIGINKLHLVDLQGALSGNQKNLSTIKNIKENAELEIQLGGGIRNFNSCEKMLKMGVSKVIFGTAAITSPKEVEKSIRTFGSDRVIVGIDVKDKNIQIKGWTEEVDLTPEQLIIDMKNIGVSEFMFTDVDKDGTLSNPDFKYLLELANSTGLNTVVAGGVSSMDHLYRLQELNIDNVVIGKAIYEGYINLEKACEIFMEKK